MSPPTPPDRHGHTSFNARPRRLLWLAAGLTGVVFLVELAGGVYSGSIALLSDAGHVLMDFTGLLFSLFAMALAERPASDRRTYGLHRLEVFAALLNGFLVTGVALGIAGESLSRLTRGTPPDAGPMILLGVLGLAANLAVAWKLHGFAGQDINLRSSFLHVLSDALASVGVLLAGVLIALTGWTAVDPLVGLAIAGLILFNALRLLKDAFNILLEGVPPHLHVPDVVRALADVPGVVRIEDVHVWALCSHLVSLSARVTLRPERMADPRVALDALHTLLRERFRIAHATLQLESAAWATPPP